MYKLLGTLLAFLAVLAMPLFAVMAGVAALAWLSHDNVDYQYLRFLAPNVLEDKFAESPILVTIPLFTFAGYLMAESKTPDRLVRAANASLGWLPGGLAVVCIIANAFFTTMTGGSGVPSVAIGGLLYPALVKQGYPSKYALGLVTAAGAVGLLFFPSPLVMVYAFISGVDINRAYIATAVPGVTLMCVLIAHAIWVGHKEKIPRGKFQFYETLKATWDVKWELMAPFLVGAGMISGLMSLDEAAAAAAFYVLIVEVYLYKDLSWRDVLRIARDAMSLSGAIILILAMATALTNYIVQERIPQEILEWFTSRGMDTTWKFIIVLNIFLFILGVVMEEYSAMLVALPLVMPLAATFGLSPFHLAVMFLLNTEIGYISPPMGINLYIASFRFNRPVVEIYRVVLPFVALLMTGLLAFIVFPKLSTFTVDEEIAKLRAEGHESGLPPRDAWMLQCVQEDRNNPHPCVQEDIDRWGEDGTKLPEMPEEDTPPADTDAGSDDLDDIMRQMMGDDAAPTKPKDDLDDIMREMMGEDPKPEPEGDKPAADDPADEEKKEEPKKKGDDLDDLMREMMGDP